MKLRHFLSILLALTLLTGCAANAAGLNPDDMFSERDLNAAYDAEKAVIVSLVGDTAVSSSPLVSVKGQTVTLTGAGTFILSGTLTDGMLIVDAGKNDKLQIVLNGAEITSSTSAPLYVRQADKVFVTLAEGSENLLENGGEFVQIDSNKVDAALYSRDDLTLNGSGALRIVSPSGHGIVSKDDLILTGGVYNITAGKDALSANDSVRISNVTLNIVSGDEGIKAEHDNDPALGYIYVSSGTLQIDARSDAMSASGDMLIADGVIHVSSDDNAMTAEGLLTVAGGIIHIEKSEEGLEGRSVLISGGVISIHATDDGINASGDDDDRNSAQNTHITISGGELYVDAEGDGIDANGSINVSGGYTVIAGPTRRGNSAVDYDKTAQITGGTFIAYGPSGMAQGFGTGSSQGAILLETGSMPAGTAITLTDASGELISVTAQKPFSTIVISTPEMVENGTYTVTAGDHRETVTLDGFLYSNIRSRVHH